jgi:hypothetical protein
MEKIYSKIEPEKLLHIIHRLDDIKAVRTDLSDPKESLQIATLNLNKGKTFYPHKHIYKKGPENIIAQESWIVLKGRIKCILYDIDDVIIAEPILEAGDSSITFYGGHNYECLEDDSRVVEMKSGPYEGIELDKVKI